MQTEAKFCLCFTKINTKLILNVFSAAPIVTLISSVGHLPNTKKLFLQVLSMRW